VAFGALWGCGYGYGPFLFLGRQRIASSMSKITALKIQKRRHDRVNVFIDDQYAFSLQSTLAARSRLGQEIDEQTIQDLQSHDDDEKAYEDALNYLSYRPRATREIARHLQEKGIEPDTIEHVLARLTYAKLIDDREFAQTWVENRTTFRPRGARAVRVELRQKGIDDEIVENALHDIDDESNAQAAGRLALRRLAALEEPVFRRRLLGLLLRRGFSYGVARQVTDDLWQEVRAQQETNPE